MKISGRVAREQLQAEGNGREQSLRTTNCAPPERVGL
jgi:hypothetical protein